MNSVNASGLIPRNPEPKVGDLYKDMQGGVHILSESSYEKYVAIGLADGVRWKDHPSPRIDDAVENLTFLGRDCVITITK